MSALHADALCIYLITDRRVVPEGRSLPDQLAMALGEVEPGQVAVQLREKDLCARELLQLGEEVARVCQKYGAPLLINDRFDVAMLLGIGVHLPAAGLPPDLALPGWPDGAPVAVSTHHPDEVEEATRRGAAMVTFGPVFSTPSKLQYGAPVGPDRLKEACVAVQTASPHHGKATRTRTRSSDRLDGGALSPDRPIIVALGGITSPAHAASTITHGAHAAGLIRAVMASRNPGVALGGVISAVSKAKEARVLLDTFAQDTRG